MFHRLTRRTPPTQDRHACAAKTTAIAQEHYLTVKDEDFAAALIPTDGARALWRARLAPISPN
jgi:hypothetical protein